MVEALLDNLDLTPDMSRERVRARIFRELDLEDFDYEELKIKVRFANGHTVKIEEDRDDDRNDQADKRDKRDKRKDKDKVQLESFKVKMIAGPRGQLEIELKREHGRTQAIVKTKYRNNHIELRGEEASIGSMISSTGPNWATVIATT